MKFETRERDGFLVVGITENITMFSNIGDVKDYILDLIEKGTLYIAISFPLDAYFSSRSIAVVVTCNERLRDVGGMLVIIQPNDQILGLLNSLGIQDRFTTCESEEYLCEIEKT
jgi:hypothetical protein